MTALIDRAPAPEAWSGGPWSGGFEHHWDVTICASTTNLVCEILRAGAVGVISGESSIATSAYCSETRRRTLVRRDSDFEMLHPESVRGSVEVLVGLAKTTDTHVSVEQLDAALPDVKSITAAHYGDKYGQSTTRTTWS